MEPTKHPPATTSDAVKWVLLFVVLAVGLLMVAAAAEGAVRLRQWIKTGTSSSYSQMYRTDEAIGLRVLNPGFKTAAISINAQGFRGPDIATPKPKGVVRIAFLGASTTFCAEVTADDKVWPSIVVDRLRQQFPGTAFDFVNGGVPGYTVASSRKNLLHRIAPLQPDIVVIYHATNDFSGEVRERAVAAGIAGAADSGRQSWLERHSLLWELVVKNLRVIRAQSALAHDQSKRLYVDASLLGTSFEHNLRSLLREAGATSTRVVVATFSTRLRSDQPHEVQQQAAVSANVYMPFMSVDGLLAGYRRYNELISQAARAEGALLIDGEDRIPGDAKHFVDTVHFSDAGSLAMANRVVESLAKDPQIVELVRLRNPR